MRRLKPYKNLNEIYMKSVKPWIISSSLLWAAAAAASVLQIVFTRKCNFLFYILIPLAISVVWITRRNTAEKSLAHFSEEGLAKLNDEINRAEAVEGFTVTSEAMAACRNQLFALPVKDIVWIYPKTLTGRVMFVPIAASFDIVVVDRNKRRYYLKGKLQNTDQAYILSFLECRLAPLRSGIFFGYTPENERLFYEDFERMVYLADNG